MSEQEPVDNHGIEVRTYFVRGRNALVARGCFSELYIDYYLHLADYALEVAPDAADFAKSALAAIGLHCASRPRAERVAWTVNFQSPLLNVFAAGDNPAGTLVANVFDKGVRAADSNMFFCDTVPGGGEPRRSVVDFEGGDFFAAAERYYAGSEQRLARFFEFAEEDYVLVSAQPDCDDAWLAGLDTAAIRRLDQDEELALLEIRPFRFACGCDNGRMLAMLAPIYRGDPDGLFGDDEVVRVTCPRCGAKHAVTREALEARQAAAGSAR